MLLAHCTAIQTTSTTLWTITAAIQTATTAFLVWIMTEHRCCGRRTTAAAATAAGRMWTTIITTDRTGGCPSFLQFSRQNLKDPCRWEYFYKTFSRSHGVGKDYFKFRSVYSISKKLCMSNKSGTGTVRYGSVLCEIIFILLWVKKRWRRLIILSLNTWTPGSGSGFPSELFVSLRGKRPSRVTSKGHVYILQVARVPPVPHQTEAAVAMTAVDTNNPWDLVPDQSKIKIHSRYPGT